MFKNLRNLAMNLAKFVGRFSSASHRKITVPLSVSLDPKKQTGNPLASNKPLTVVGLTQNISKNGIDFVIPFIRLGDHHLAGHGGEQKQLQLVLETPNGKVRMSVVTKHYQMIEVHNSVQNYLIATEILSIYKGDVERYANFLRYGDKAVSAAKVSHIKLASQKEKRSLLGHLSIF